MAGEISGDVGPRKRKEERRKERKQARGWQRRQQPSEVAGGRNKNETRAGVIDLDGIDAKERKRERKGGRRERKSEKRKHWIAVSRSLFPRGWNYYRRLNLGQEATFKSQRTLRGFVRVSAYVTKLQFCIKSKVKIAMSEHVLILDIFLIVLVSGHGYLNISNTYHVLNIPCTLC